MKRHTWLGMLLGMMLLAGAGGCSSFDRDWNAAAGKTPSSPTDITGRWEGTWASEENGHNGGLRCLVTQVNETTYLARFAATYGAIFHFQYEMNLTGEPLHDWVPLKGSADLGKMAGGVYHYDGMANSTKFYANYRSDEDWGQFNMSRPEGK